MMELGSNFDNLLEWIRSEYSASEEHEAEATESLYLKITYRNIQVCKIRLSSHLAVYLSADLMIVDAINSDTYIAYLKTSTMPICFNFEELKSFIRHFIFIKYSEKVAKITKDASTAVKADIVDSLTKVEIAELPDINADFECKNLKYNDPGFRKKHWKDFRGEYLIKKFPKYNVFSKGIIALVKTIYTFEDAANDELTLSSIQAKILDSLKKCDSLNNALQNVYSQLRSSTKTGISLLNNPDLRIKYPEKIDASLLERNDIFEYDKMTIKQKEIIKNLLLTTIPYGTIVTTINKANQYGRDIKKMKRAADALIKQNSQS